MDAVVRPVAHVNQTVARAAHAVRVAELFGRFNAGLVGRLFPIVGHAAVGAPVAFVRAGSTIEHDHAFVAVTVADINFVGARVGFDCRGLAQLRARVAAFGFAGLADLQHELALARELQNVMIGAVVAGDPHKTLIVDVYAVFLPGPVITLIVFRGPPPAAHVIAVGIELDHRGRGDTAAVGGRLGLRAFFIGEQGVRAMQQPHVIAFIDRDAGDLAENPIVLQRLGSARVDLITRYRTVTAWRALRRRLRAAQHGQRARCGDDGGPFDTC